MAKKQLNVLGIVFAALVLVGLVLAIVGMCTPVISMTMGNESDAVGLSHEMWDKLAETQKLADAFKLDVTIPSRTFTIIAFVVTLIGAVALVAHAVLALLGKDIKILGLAAGAVTIVGAVLVLVAGLVLAGQFTDLTSIKELGLTGIEYSAGIGIWLGFIGGLVAGVAGLLSALKIGQK